MTISQEEEKNRQNQKKSGEEISKNQYQQQPISSNSVNGAEKKET